MNLLYLFLPCIIFIGLITSYTDIKYGKIKNRWAILAIIYTLIVYAFLIIFYKTTGVEIRNSYIIEIIITGFFSILIGYIMWVIGFWTAGDAKLFFAYSLLIPLSVYQYGHYQYFSSTNIIINTFVPFFAVLSIFLLFKTSLKQKIFYLKKSFIPKVIIQVLIFLFAFIWIAQLFFSFFNINPDYFIMVVFLFVFMIALEKLIPLRLYTVVIILSVLRLIFDKTSYSLESLKFLFITWILFILLRFFILYLGYNLLTKKVDIKLLKKGMVPSEKIYLEGGKYKKHDMLYFSLFSYLYEKTQKRDYVFEPLAEGLSESDVKKLKKLEDKFDFEHLRVHQTLSFSPFMFGGVLLTIIFQGNMFIALHLLLF